MDGEPLPTVRLATGVTVPYIEQGDRSGVPVLQLHPWAESMGCFDRVLPLLPPTLYVLAWDQRGHGAADKLLDGYELSEQAKGVLAQIHGYGTDEAFNALRAYCRSHHLRLSQVAHTITTNPADIPDLTTRT